MIGSVGGSEFLLIAVLALLLFGPRKLPQIGRSLGRAMAEFRGAANEFRSTLEREVEVESIREVREEVSEAGREVRDATRELTRVEPPREATVERADDSTAAPEKGPERDDPAEDGNARRA